MLALISLFLFFVILISLVMLPSILSEYILDKRVAREMLKLLRLPNVDIASLNNNHKEVLVDILKDIKFCGGIEIENSRIRYENNIWSIDPNNAGKFTRIDYALAQNYIIACIA